MRGSGSPGSVHSRKAAGYCEAFGQDPPEPRRIYEIVDELLVGKEAESGLLGIFDQLQGLRQGKIGLNQHRLGEVDDKSQTPHSLFFFF